MDFFPTFLDLAGHPGVTDRIIDGKNLKPILFSPHDEQEEIIHDYFFHWCGNTLHAMRDQSYKLHWITPIWDDGTEHCDSVVICQCAGRRNLYHKQPLLYNIREDPGENNPLDPDSSEYLQILNRFEKQREAHSKTFTPVPNQLESLPRPWAMPCCNSSGYDCSCYENNFDFEYLLDKSRSAAVNPFSTWHHFSNSK